MPRLLLCEISICCYITVCNKKGIVIVVSIPCYCMYGMWCMVSGISDSMIMQFVTKVLIVLNVSA